MRIAAALLTILLASCATPVAPSGGPPDETPPAVVETEPAAEAVNVSTGTLRITFSEYVDEASFTEAFTVTPAFSTRPQFVWGRRSVEVRFPEPLRENTTYVVTLDTRLRDLHGVALPAPITVAFSTGPTISRGVIAGQVVGPESGQPAPGVDVLAYAVTDSAAPATLPERPDYRTQTDQDGAFRFDYLTEQPYYVAALSDQNRNRRPDANEAFAPPPVPAIRADTTPVDLGLPWILTRVDTTRPEPLRIQSLSSRRHILHASESILLLDRDPAGWELTDSSTGRSIPIEEIYRLTADLRSVHFTTPPLTQTVHGIRADALADSSGNLISGRPIGFTPASAEDTLQIRFLQFLPEQSAALAESIDPGLRFNAPPPADLLNTAVTVQDSTGTPFAFDARTHDGTDYFLMLDPPLQAGDVAVVRVDAGRLAGPDSVFSRTYTRVPYEATGEISGVVLPAHPPAVVEAIPVEVIAAVEPSRAIADSSGAFIFRNLPEGTYRLRAFADRDGDGMWDGGLLVPYTPPEAITWRNEPTRVRARWETSLPDTLRIPSP